MGGKKKSKGAAEAAPQSRCECEEKRRCTCGNRPERPSHGHIWNGELQQWTGRGAREARRDAKLKDAGATEKDGVKVENWQKLPSQLLHEWCQRERRPKPRYHEVGATGRTRVVLADPKKSDKDMSFCPKDDATRETAALLALLNVCEALPLERKLPDLYRDLWLQSKKGTGTLTADRAFASRAEAERERAEKSAEKKAMLQKRENFQRANPAPKVYMSSLVRRDLCRLLGVEEPDDDRDDCDDAIDALPDIAERQRAAHLVSLGFTPGRVVQAVRESSSTDEALSWLLLRTPEAELPEGFDPDGENLDVVVPQSRSHPGTAAEAIDAWLTIHSHWPGESPEPADDSSEREDEIEALMSASVRRLERRQIQGFGDLILGGGGGVCLLIPSGYPTVPPACLGLGSSELLLREACQSSDVSLFDLLETAFKPPPPPPKKHTIPAAVAASKEKTTDVAAPTKKKGWFDWDGLKEIPEAKPSKLVQSQREQLPGFKARKEALNAFQKSRVVLVESGTGAGKTTQIPQFLLEDGPHHKKIVVAQPRRLAATGVAHRVAEERGERIGEVVGYAVRGDSAATKKTAILFCTTGVLLQRLRTHDLTNVSHVVVDEVHERGIDSDVLLVLLLDALDKTSIKVILMSATIDASKFLNYFRKFNPQHLKIPGFAFPVTVKYADAIADEFNLQNITKRAIDSKDYDKDAALKLAALLTKRIIFQRRGSSVLIFVAGVGDVAKVCRYLSDEDSLKVIPLHGGLSPAEQRTAFMKFDNKVVVATNVAQTSITIPDVTVVIDTLRVNETGYDPNRDLPCLTETFVAKDAADQRKGRAGRVQEGTCYRLLQSHQMYQNTCVERSLPEITRVPLDGLCVQALAMNRDPVTDLAPKLLDPPSTEALQAALLGLSHTGAVSFKNDDSSYELTCLGRHLATMPVAARLGKLAVLGACFGPACRQMTLTIAAGLGSARSIWRSSPEIREKVDAAKKKLRAEFKCGRSDHCLVAAAFQVTNQGLHKQKVDDMGLSHSVLMEMRTLRQQLDRALTERGFVASSSSSTTLPGDLSGPGLWRVVRAVVTAALYPRVLKVLKPNQKFADTKSGAIAVNPNSRELRFVRADRHRVFLHPSSHLFNATENLGQWLVYGDLIDAHSKLSCRDVTEAPPFALLLFTGLLSPKPTEKLIHIAVPGAPSEAWMAFAAHPRVAVLVQRLRLELDNLLQAKSSDPSLPTADAPVVAAIIRLLLYDGLA